jgi:hypothetical protein
MRDDVKRQLDASVGAQLRKSLGQLPAISSMTGPGRDRDRAAPFSGRL